MAIFLEPTESVILTRCSAPVGADVDAWIISDYQVMPGSPFQTVIPLWEQPYKLFMILSSFDGRTTLAHSFGFGPSSIADFA